MKPTVIFVPGFWVGPAPFANVSERLVSAGYKVEVATLLSTGTTSPGNPNMRDDIAAVRSQVENVLDRGENVLLVLHSAGAFIGGAAIEGLTKKERQGQAGVLQVIFLSGAVYPLYYAHQPLPFAVVEGGASNCMDPSKLLFGDLSEAECQKWLPCLKPQPAHDWDDKIPYVPWANVPSIYIICEKDNILPVSFQEQLASTAGSKLERVPAGHMPMLSTPDLVVRLIQTAIEDEVSD